jgi:hypothetical protein
MPRSAGPREPPRRCPAPPTTFPTRSAPARSRARPRRPARTPAAARRRCDPVGCRTIRGTRRRSPARLRPTARGRRLTASAGSRVRPAPGPTTRSRPRGGSCRPRRRPGACGRCRRRPGSQSPPAPPPGHPARTRRPPAPGRPLGWRPGGRRAPPRRRAAGSPRPPAHDRHRWSVAAAPVGTDHIEAVPGVERQVLLVGRFEVGDQTGAVALGQGRRQEGGAVAE